MTAAADIRARGLAALEAGEARAAAALFEGLLRDFPADADGWFLLGASRHRAGENAAAREAFAQAAALAPSHLQSRFALAAVCLDLGDSAGALVAAESALALAPDSPQPWFGRGVALEACGRPLEALADYERALAIDARHAGSLLNRGALLRALGRFDAAVDNERRQAELQPFSPDAQFRFGDALLSAGRHEEAARAFGRALKLSPANARFLLHHGFALAQSERFDEAQAALDRAAALAPEQVAACRRSIFGEGDDAPPALDARVLFLLRHYDAIERCDWRSRERFVAAFRMLVGTAGERPLVERALGFRALAMGLDQDIQAQLAGQIAAGIRRQAAGAAAIRRTVHDGARLRIGYLSGDFRRHATAYLMCRLPELHDRARFEVFLYATGPDDGSELRHRLQTGADRFVDVAACDDAGLAQRIADDAIDILVDLSGYIDHARPGVLARRPAPLQVGYLAYLQTSGGDWTDYAIADRHILPPALRFHWTERIAFLPDTLYLCDDRAISDTPAGSRADEGLPANRFVFCCLNASWKIDPDTFACWMEILRRVPDAVLWLYATADAVEDNLRRAASAAGVDAARLLFARRVPHAQHLARFRHADLFLDTFVCNAHTTAVEALAAGLPVLTLPGATPAARVGGSLLRAHGLDELVAASTEGYVDLACALAADPARLAGLRRRAAERCGSRLFCTERRVREIERAYEAMWARHRSGLPAADIEVPAAAEGTE